MSYRLALIPSLLAALALAGCGGGGDETTESAPVVTEESTALTKSELIAQGDGICAEVNAAVGSVETSESETGVARVADLYSGMVERIKGLGEPQESEGYAEFAAAADELDQAQSDLALAAERGEENLAEAEASASSALSSFQEAASDYGFEDCSEGPSAPTAPSGGAGQVEGEEELEYVPGEEEVAPEEVAPEEEAAPAEPAPETGGGGGTPGGGTGAGGEVGEGGGSAGGIGPG